MTKFNPTNQKFNPSEYTIEIYWKEYDDVYKIYSLYEEDYYYFETSKNGFFHSIEGEHAVFESKFSGTEIREEYYKDGNLHNLYGYATRVCLDEMNGDDEIEDCRYYIDGTEYSYLIYDSIATKILYETPVDDIHKEAIEISKMAREYAINEQYEKNDDRCEIFKQMLRQEITTYDDQIINTIKTFEDYKVKNCHYKLVEKLFDIKIKNENYKKFGLDVVFRNEFYHDEGEITYEDNIVVEVYDGEYSREITLKDFELRTEFKKCAMHNIYRAGFCKDVAHLITNFMA